MKNFAIKFIDIMIGIILGLGFQWWPNLIGPWQYVAFVFIYLDIIDYWIDYSPALKKFPPKSEIDFMADIGIMFSLFLVIFATQTTLVYFLISFIVFRVIDTLWLLRVRYQYHPIGLDKVFVDTWIRFNLTELVFSLLIAAAAWFELWSVLNLLIIFIILRIITRVLASLQYKEVHFI